MAFVPDNLDSLKYAGLQQLAKQCGVKANMKADKLKAALIQYKRNQPSHNSKLELRKSGASQRTPDVGKDLLSKKESLSTGKKVKQLSAKSPPDMFLEKPSLSLNKSIKQISMKSTPDVGKDVLTKKESLSTGKKAKQLSARSALANSKDTFVKKPSLSPSKSARQSSMKTPPDISMDIVMNKMDDSSCGEVRAEELAMSPDDDEVVIQNNRPGKRSTFELDQPPVSIKSKRPKKCIDWAAIHQWEFEKMDSLDVYVKKREERRRRLKTPVKRAAAFAAKLAGGQETSAAKLQKSLTKPAVFAPSILSTKQMNTNFSTMFKSPSVVASKTPFKPGQLRKSIVKENTSTPAQSAVNGSLLSTSTAAAKRPAFDLKASLARPLTWTPHRGKLKPYSVSRVDVKSFKPKTREERRDEAHAKRHTQRQAATMHRRLAEC